MPLPPIDALVTSGDYKFNNVLENKAGGGHGSAQLAGLEHWLTTIGTDNVGFPTTERSIGVQVFVAGRPVVGLPVELVRKQVAGGPEGVVVRSARRRC